MLLGFVLLGSAAAYAPCTRPLLRQASRRNADPIAIAEIMKELDVGEALRTVEDGYETGLVLESVGRDILIFLAASVAVTPASKFLRITPILGYLLVGAALGPHGLDVFANSEADLELGDFGILFLLFAEGLEVSAARLRSLGSYVPLGFAQLSLTTGVLTAAVLLGAPEFLERFLPLDSALINVRNPAEAVVLALALTLSTSAFVFPVLEQQGWAAGTAGRAATSILLLQDLAVAPLLVAMPFVVGAGPVDPTTILDLTLRATVGFGAALAGASLIARPLFRAVAETRAPEAFVALCLLVAAGMGAVAKEFGLTDTAGAFAAGVLLANTDYRAQIQADILPFKGILLGVFFMVAGSSFDVELAAREWPTVATGVVALVTLKAATVLFATRIPRRFEANRLPWPDAVRVALLLSGGGEFAFVVLALAEKLGVLPKDLGGLLTAIVLVTMALTPLLGDAAALIAAKAEEGGKEGSEPQLMDADVAPDAVVVCGYGDVGRGVLEAARGETSEGHACVAFTTRFAAAAEEDDAVRWGDAANPAVVRATGVARPRAVFVTYKDPDRNRNAVTRLRAAFPAAPIFSRALTRAEAAALKSAGANEVVVEFDELAKSAPALLLASSSSGGRPLSDSERKALGVAEPLDTRDVAALSSDWSDADA